MNELIFCLKRLFNFDYSRLDHLSEVTDRLITGGFACINYQPMVLWTDFKYLVTSLSSSQNSPLTSSVLPRDARPRVFRQKASRYLQRIVNQRWTTIHEDSDARAEGILNDFPCTSRFQYMDTLWILNPGLSKQTLDKTPKSVVSIEGVTQLSKNWLQSKWTPVIH